MSNRVLVGLVSLSLVQVAGCPILVTDVTQPGARVQTSLGDFVIELDPENAPITVSNFLQYVDDGFYDGTTFHRVILDFVVQGGGLTPDLVEKETRSPIINESDNGLLNVRGAVAMARSDDPDSATAQFFVNLADNPDLDASPDGPGYAVFGRVIEGMDVVDQIALIPTEQRDGLSDVPVEDVVIENVEQIVLSSGELELTPEGQAYLESQTYRALTLLRELAVQLLGYAIARPW
jgi:peptidyl-prolyl cis-trans isomerase A (cyclophilin A)